MNRAIRYSSKKALLIALVIGMIPSILGGALVYLKSNADLSGLSATAVKEAARQIDVMLEEAENASDILLTRAGLPCPGNISRQLQELVATYRFLRSTHLAIDDKIYCSSLPPSEARPGTDPNNYLHGRLHLGNQTLTGSNSSALTLRSALNNASSLVEIDGRHIQDALHLIDRHSNLVLEIGRHWMSQDGIIHHASFENYPIASTALSSEKYGYTLYAAYPAGTLLTYMLNTYLLLLVLLLALGLFAGVFTYWMLGRVLAPSLELQRALSADEFTPYLQPVISSTSGKCVGCEVLARWYHPQEGSISPNSFIPLAEQSNLIISITKRLMEKTAQELVPYASKLEAPFHIGFNISAKHFESFELVDDCISFLKSFKPGQIILVLELTERELIQPTRTATRLIEKLHALGVKIALDDFGTGHSSLNYLQLFKVDYIKIDKSFVSMIGANALSVHILDSILDLALKLDLQVLAEGVETEEQRDYLGACGVDFMQGYFYAKPMPVTDFVSKALHHPQKNPALP